MMVQPASIADLQASTPTHGRLLVRGGGTKPGLSGRDDGRTVLDMRRLAGIVEHTPEECTFTALAGTLVADIELTLAAHGQYLPFDPPLGHRGATIGGSVAAGVNGSCRYRYGGIRDFLIGARIVDGCGRVVRSGGKVVKNAAGFLVHQALVGSCGRLGVLAELTFKVFPAAEAHTTLRVTAPDVTSAADAIAAIQRARCELDAIDLEPPGTLWLRLGGFREALPSRVSAVRSALGHPADILTGEKDWEVWQVARDYAWVPDGLALVRVPITLPALVRLDTALEWYEATRRYAVGGNVALIAWNGALDALSDLLTSVGLVGQVLIGPPGEPFIGAIGPNAFEDRLRSVMDPDGRFSVPSRQ